MGASRTSRRNSTPSVPVHFTGKVTKVELINPHSWIHVDVKMPDGTTQNWMFEAGSPNVLLRRGFNKNTIAWVPKS